MNEQTIYLDVNKAVSPTQMVRIGQGDVAGTTINAYIYDNGAAADLTDMSARFEMRLPNSGMYVRDASCTIEGNVITYVVDEAHAASVAGITDVAYFDILDGHEVIYSTERFSIEVLPSAHDGATPAQSWDTEIDELIQRGEQAVSDAEQAVDDATSAIDAANQAIAQIEPTIEQAAEDAAEQATADAEQRIQDAIDAVGEISELAVPLMSPDTRGGAKLEEHGGLALRDGALGIGSLVQESDGYARGGLAQVTAKGHAEQFSTTGKNLLPITTSQTVNGVTLTVNDDGACTLNGTATSQANFYLLQDNIIVPDGTISYLSGCPVGGSMDTYLMSTKNALGQWVNTYYDFGNGSIQPHGIMSVMLTVRKDITVSNLTFYPQLELGSTATEYEPYTGGAPSPSPDYPQEIQVVRGRNLLDEANVTWIVGSYINQSGDVSTSSGTNYMYEQEYIEVDGSESYLIQFVKTSSVNVATSIAFYDSSKTFISRPVAIQATTTTGIVFGAVTAPSNAMYARISMAKDALQIQLTLGSTPQPYVPYGHVGMEVRDPDTDELISCTALPLPSRGWVAGLRDGTADSLRLDGAGKCEWELADAETTTAATDGVTGTIGVDVLSTTGQIADGATVLYKLATPVTEDCGYVDVPEISGECQVSIPELDAFGIRYFVDDTVTQYGREIYARVRSEYADRLTVLEQAVAELATS